MKRIELQPNFQLNVEFESAMAYRIDVLYRNEKENYWGGIGKLYGIFIEESAAINEYGRPHWQWIFYFQESKKNEMSSNDIERMIAILKSNIIIKEPATLEIRYLATRDIEDIKTFQIGRIYETDPDPFPSFEKNEK